jgi:uncharacterized protein involved in propanediol utilization
MKEALNYSNEFYLQDNDFETLRVGKGYSYSHFGEYLQAYFPDLPEKTDRAAISTPVVDYERAVDLSKRHNQQNLENSALEMFPIAKVGSKAKFTIKDKENIELINNEMLKSKKAAELTLKYLNKSKIGGILDVVHQLPEGYGLGTSTSDVIATINAVADSFYIKLSNAEVAEIALQAEGACDAVMYDKAGLFITTKCKFLEYYDVDFPGTLILGLNFQEENEGIDTLSLPVREYSSEENQKLSLLRKGAKKALLDGDTKLLGRVSTESALINQRLKG